VAVLWGTMPQKRALFKPPASRTPQPTLPARSQHPVETAFAAIAALTGLILGSFATCAGHRLAHGGSVTSPARSYCPACDHTLSWRENLPLLGYLLQGGRCRFCHARIPARYPLAELILALYCLAAAQVFGPGLPWLIAAFFGTLLLVLSLIDLEAYLLPDILTLPGAALALVASSFLPPSHTLGIGWRQALLGAALGGGGLWLLSELYRRLRGREGLGLGDAKLLMLVGALLGPLAIPLTLVGGALFALPFGLVAAVRTAREDAAATNDPATDHPLDDDELNGTGLSAAIPFGPFLCAAAALSLLYGPQLLRWWLGIG
jgi:leader peptidase (prepilin peptidase)/N-methyltransferase